MFLINLHHVGIAVADLDASLAGGATFTEDRAEGSSALSLDGQDDHLLVAGLQLDDVFTVSLWAKILPGAQNIQGLAVNSGGGFAGTRTFERRAAIGGQPLHGAGEIGVSGSGARDARGLVDAPVLVVYLYGERRSDRDAVSDSGQNVGGVAFDRHSPATTESPLTAP